MDFNLIENMASKEIQDLTSCILPFMWITRAGSIIEDYPITPGLGRAKDVLKKYNINARVDDLFNGWIRVDGLLITVNCKLNKFQIDTLQDLLREFSPVYGDYRVKFVSKYYKFMSSLLKEEEIG